MPFEDLFASRVWEGYLTTAAATSATSREEAEAAAPLTRQDSRSRRRSADLAPSRDRRRPSEPRYYVASDVSPPTQMPEQPTSSRTRQSSGGDLARPTDISPPAAPQPARAQPVAIGAPQADQGAAMVRRPSSSSARRYSTLGRGNSYRPPERTTPDSVSPVSQEVAIAPASDRPPSRASIDRPSDAGRPASAHGNMQESEYVVVEKKTVEVNALADGEFSSSYSNVYYGTNLQRSL